MDPWMGIKLSLKYMMAGIKFASENISFEI
jgi:hypothetical protein